MAKLSATKELPVGCTMRAAHQAARTLPNTEVVKAGELVEARFAKGTAFHMLSTGEAFRDLGESYLDQVARKRSTAKLVQRLSNLGYDVMLVPKAA
jgi:hypothetical protein